MMKHDSRTPEDGTHVGSPSQTDWPLDQIKELARELYIRFPFDDEDHPDGWKDLVREAFIVFDNLDQACKEILRERSEERKAAAGVQGAYKKLPTVVPFDKAVRYITREKRTDRAESNFEKVLNYQARIVPFEGVSPNLGTEQKRQLGAQLNKWRKNGIRRQEAIQLRSRYEHCWPLVVAEQNSAKTKRRGGKRPVVERRLQMPLVLMSELNKQRRKRS